MTVLPRKSEMVLQALIALADGDPEIVERALRELNERAASPPDVKELMRRILEIRKERNTATAAAAI